MKKIFGLGLSRTGTTTLNETLIRMGYNTIHYPSQDQLFSDNNNGATDIPVIPVYPTLDAMFKGSKFILTIRDKEKWMNSMHPYLERKRNWNQSTTQVQLRVDVYGAPFFEKEKYSAAFDNHHNNVIEYFKDRPNDLLILDILGGESPKKLYDFLGHKNPPETFGHWNMLKK